MQNLEILSFMLKSDFKNIPHKLNLGFLSVQTIVKLRQSKLLETEKMILLCSKIQSQLDSNKPALTQVLLKNSWGYLSVWMKTQRVVA